MKITAYVVYKWPTGKKIKVCKEDDDDDADDDDDDDDDDDELLNQRWWIVFPSMSTHMHPQTHTESNLSQGTRNQLFQEQTN